MPKTRFWRGFESVFAAKNPPLVGSKSPETGAKSPKSQLNLLLYLRNVAISVSMRFFCQPAAFF